MAPLAIASSSGSSGTGPPPTRIARGPGEVGAGLEQPGQHRRHQRDDGDPVALRAARADAVDVEAVVDDRGGAVDDRAHDDPEPGDVAERQAAEPAVVGLDADVEGGADRAPEEVAVGEADRVRGAGAAAGQDAGSRRRPCRARRAAACRPRSGSARRRRRGRRSAPRRRRSSPAPPRSGAGSSGSSAGPDLHQRVRRAPPARGAGAWSAPRSSRGARRGRRAGARPRSPPPRARRRSSRRRRRPARSGRGSSGISGRASRRASSGISCPSCPNATRSPARAGPLRADRVGEPPASTRTSATRPADGIAKVTIDRPEVLNAFRPQTLIEVSRRAGAGARGPRGRRDRPHRRGRAGVLLGRRPDGARRHRLHAEGAAVGRFHVTDLQVQMRRLPKPVVAMVAGYAIGGGHILHVCCDLTIAADNASSARPGRGSAPGTAASAPRCCATWSGPRRRRSSGCSAASTTPRRRWRWAWSTRSCRSPSSSARRSPGAARCWPSPPSPCAWSRPASTPTRTATPGSSSSPTTPTSSSTAARRRPRVARRSRRSGRPTSRSSRGAP